MISIFDFSISDLISSKISIFKASKWFLPTDDFAASDPVKLSNLLRVEVGTFGLKASVEFFLLPPVRVDWSGGSALPGLWQMSRSEFCLLFASLDFISSIILAMPPPVFLPVPGESDSFSFMDWRSPQILFTFTQGDGD